MASAEIIAIISLVLGGIAVGVVIAVAISVRREDRRFTLVGDAPDRMSRGARRLNGGGRRDLDPVIIPPDRQLVH